MIAPSGQSIFFDAKTTKRKALDFDNLHSHQIIFLQRMSECGAIAGFLVEFRSFKEVYFISIAEVLAFQKTRRSIPYSYFSETLQPAAPGNGIILDYLKIAVNKI